MNPATPAEWRTAAVAALNKVTAQVPGQPPQPDDRRRVEQITAYSTYAIACLALADHIEAP